MKHSNKLQKCSKTKHIIFIIYKKKLTKKKCKLSVHINIDFIAPSRLYEDNIDIKSKLEFTFSSLLEQRVHAVDPEVG